MSKERDQKKNRVYEIYGIPKEDRHKYNIHHIIFKSDPDWISDKDAISNLYPMLKSEHAKLHRKVQKREKE